MGEFRLRGFIAISLSTLLPLVADPHSPTTPTPSVSPAPASTPTLSGSTSSPLQTQTPITPTPTPPATAPTQTPEQKAEEAKKEEEKRKAEEAKKKKEEAKKKRDELKASIKNNTADSKEIIVGTTEEPTEKIEGISADGSGAQNKVTFEKQGSSSGTFKAQNGGSNTIILKDSSKLELTSETEDSTTYSILAKGANSKNTIEDLRNITANPNTGNTGNTGSGAATTDLAIEGFVASEGGINETKNNSALKNAKVKNILAKGENSRNNLKFAQGSAITQKIQANNSGINDIELLKESSANVTILSAEGGINNITLKDSSTFNAGSTTNTAGNTAGAATNGVGTSQESVILAKGANAQNNITDARANFNNVAINGNIKAESGGINNITLNSASTKAIISEGENSANNINLGKNSSISEKISASNSGANTINLNDQSSATNIIIASESGTNTITLKNATGLTLTKETDTSAGTPNSNASDEYSILASGGTNTISDQRASHSNITLAGAIIARSSGSNILDLKNASTQSILSQDSNSNNTITLSKTSSINGKISASNSGANTITLKNDSAIKDTVVSANAGVNTITLNDAATLTLASTTESANNANNANENYSILSTGQGAKNTIIDERSNRKAVTFSSNVIAKNGGINEITLDNLTAKGVISDGQSSSNNLKLAQSSNITEDISAKNSGQNDITLGHFAKISKLIKAESSGQNTINVNDSSVLALSSGNDANDNFAYSLLASGTSSSNTISGSSNANQSFAGGVLAKDGGSNSVTISNLTIAGKILASSANSSNNLSLSKASKINDSIIAKESGTNTITLSDSSKITGSILSTGTNAITLNGNSSFTAGAIISGSSEVPTANIANAATTADLGTGAGTTLFGGANIAQGATLPQAQNTQVAQGAKGQGGAKAQGTGSNIITGDSNAQNSVNGNVEALAGTNQITLKKLSISGDLLANGGSNTLEIGNLSINGKVSSSNANSKNDIKVKEKGTIKGNVESSAGSNVADVTNTTISGKVSATAQGATNTLTLKKSKIENDVEATAQGATNTITLSNNSQSKNIIAKDGGANTITLNDNSKITGYISAEKAGKNTLTLNGKSSLNITAEKDSASIIANGENSNNTISGNSSGASSVSSNIIAKESGVNSITLKSATLRISKDIQAQSKGTNTLDLATLSAQKVSANTQGSKNTITAKNITISDEVKATEGGQNKVSYTNGYVKNVIATGKSIAPTNDDKTTNEITISGSGKITGYVHSEKAAQNAITLNGSGALQVTTKSGETWAIKADNKDSKNTFAGSSNALNSISGDVIASDSGKNVIIVNDINHRGKLNAQSQGQNLLSVINLTQTGDITIDNGTNAIKADALNLTGNILASGNTAITQIQNGQATTPQTAPAAPAGTQSGAAAGTNGTVTAPNQTDPAINITDTNKAGENNHTTAIKDINGKNLLSIGSSNNAGFSQIRGNIEATKQGYENDIVIYNLNQTGNVTASDSGINTIRLFNSIVRGAITAKTSGHNLLKFGKENSAVTVTGAITAESSSQNSIIFANGGAKGGIIATGSNAKNVIEFGGDNFKGNIASDVSAKESGKNSIKFKYSALKGSVTALANSNNVIEDVSTQADKSSVSGQILANGDKALNTITLKHFSVRSGITSTGSGARNDLTIGSDTDTNSVDANVTAKESATNIIDFTKTSNLNGNILAQANSGNEITDKDTSTKTLVTGAIRATGNGAFNNIAAKNMTITDAIYANDSATNTAKSVETLLHAKLIATADGKNSITTDGGTIESELISATQNKASTLNSIDLKTGQLKAQNEGADVIIAIGSGAKNTITQALSDNKATTPQATPAPNPAPAAPATPAAPGPTTPAAGAQNNAANVTPTALAQTHKSYTKEELLKAITNTPPQSNASAKEKNLLLGNIRALDSGQNTIILKQTQQKGSILARNDAINALIIGDESDSKTSTTDGDFTSRGGHNFARYTQTFAKHHGVRALTTDKDSINQLNLYKKSSFEGYFSAIASDTNKAENTLDLDNESKDVALVGTQITDQADLAVGTGNDAVYTKGEKAKNTLTTKDKNYIILGNITADSGGTNIFTDTATLKQKDPQNAPGGGTTQTPSTPDAGTNTPGAPQTPGAPGGTGNAGAGAGTTAGTGTQNDYSFTNLSMAGSIYAQRNKAKNYITIKNSSYIQEGVIDATGEEVHNNIDANNSSQIKNVNVRSIDNGGNATNTIEAKDTATLGFQKRGESKDAILAFGEKAKNDIKGSTTGKNTVIGDITADTSAKNSINLTHLDIKGDILTSNFGTNKIDITGSDATHNVIGDIRALTGENTLNFSQTKLRSAEIISKNVSKNTITFSNTSDFEIKDPNVENKSQKYTILSEYINSGNVITGALKGLVEGNLGALNSGYNKIDVENALTIQKGFISAIGANSSNIIDLTHEDPKGPKENATPAASTPANPGATATGTTGNGGTGNDAQGNPGAAGNVAATKKPATLRLDLIANKNGDAIFAESTRSKNILKGDVSTHADSVIVGNIRSNLEGRNELLLSDLDLDGDVISKSGAINLITLGKENGNQAKANTPSTAGAGGNTNANGATATPDPAVAPAQNQAPAQAQDQGQDAGAAGVGGVGNGIANAAVAEKSNVVAPTKATKATVEAASDTTLRANTRSNGSSKIKGQVLSFGTASQNEIKSHVDTNFAITEKDTGALISDGKNAYNLITGKSTEDSLTSGRIEARNYAKNTMTLTNMSLKGSVLATGFGVNKFEFDASKSINLSKFDANGKGALNTLFSKETGELIAGLIAQNNGKNDFRTKLKDPKKVVFNITTLSNGDNTGVITNVEQIESRMLYESGDTRVLFTTKAKQGDMKKPLSEIDDSEYSSGAYFLPNPVMADGILKDFRKFYPKNEADVFLKAANKYEIGGVYIGRINFLKKDDAAAPAAPAVPQAGNQAGQAGNQADLDAKANNIDIKIMDNSALGAVLYNNSVQNSDISIELGKGAKWLVTPNQTADLSLNSLSGNDVSALDPSEKNTLATKLSIVDLATGGYETKSGIRKSTFTTLSIKDAKSLDGVVFRLFADDKKADKIDIQNASTDTRSALFQVYYDTKSLGKEIKKPILISQVSSSAKDKFAYDIRDTKVDQGYLTITTNFIKKNEAREGTTDDMIDNYYIAARESVVSKAAKGEASGLVLNNYLVFLSHLDDANMRFGERRFDRNRSDALWARTYGGRMRQDFGSSFKNDYFAGQVGYDYDIVTDDATHIIGVALGGGLNFIDSTQNSLLSKNIQPIAYYSYLQDDGLYANSKALYNLIDTTKRKGDLQNELLGHAFALNQDVGYRLYAGSFYVDANASATAGYLSGFDAIQKSGDMMLKSSTDNFAVLRGTAGASAGYVLKLGDTKTDFVLGANYISDYSFAKLKFDSFGAKSTEDTPLNNMVNVKFATNSYISDQTRLYGEVNTSFLGKTIQNVYGVNLGIRYAFGDTDYKAQKEVKFKEEKKPDYKVLDIKAQQTSRNGLNPESGFYVELIALPAQNAGLNAYLARSTYRIYKDGANVRYLIGPLKDEAQAKATQGAISKIAQSLTKNPNQKSEVYKVNNSLK